MTEASLFDLPNELFPFIFQYIKCTDLIQAFSEIQSCRIQTLIQPFIVHLDISQRTTEWMHTYLPHIFRQQNILAVRLEDKQLDFISQYSSSLIQLVHVISSDWTTDVLKEGIAALPSSLRELAITFTYPHGKADLASHLFRSTQQLEQLHILGRCLYFDQQEIHTCTRLTHLTVELEGMYRVFVLIEHLPALRDLKVRLRSEERLVEPKRNIIAKPTLQQVTFTGCTKYFDHLEKFGSLFGLSITSLTIHLDLMYFIVDGKRLEHALLDPMPCLVSLNLIIHCTAAFCSPIEIETFRSSTWLKFDPVVYWNDRHAHQHTIFTVPYKSDRFKHLSNEFLSTFASNRPVSFSFERVRTLSLITSTPLTLKTFQFLSKAFPKIQTLELTNSIKFPELHNDDEQLQTLSLLNDDLLTDHSLQLFSVTKFCFLSRSQRDDSKLFRRLLHLFPNLVFLQMYIGRALFRKIGTDAEEGDWLRQALERIQLLQMVHFYDEKTVLSNEEIHCLFPNARILFDYEDI